MPWGGFYVRAVVGAKTRPRRLRAQLGFLGQSPGFDLTCLVNNGNDFTCFFVQLRLSGRTASAVGKDNCPFSSGESLLIAPLSGGSSFSCVRETASVKLEKRAQMRRYLERSCILIKYKGHIRFQMHEQVATK